MLIVMRILSSGTGCSVTVVGAATISDIWEVKERGTAMSIYYLGPLLGPAIGPVIGGVLTQTFDWRATQWFLTIYGAIFLVGILFCLPETLRNPQRVSNGTSTEGSGDGQAMIPSKGSTKYMMPPSIQKVATPIIKALVDPLRILTYLRFPAILITAYFASITFGIIGIWAMSIQESFSSPPYRYSSLIVGLLYLPFSVGLVLGSLCGGKWSDYIMTREARRSGRYDEKGTAILWPEDRMRENAWLSIVFFPGALIWYGWTVHEGVLWVVPVQFPFSLLYRVLCMSLKANLTFANVFLDDLYFLHWRGQHVDIRHGHNNVDRVCTTQKRLSHRPQQFGTQSVFLHWWRHSATLDIIHRHRLAFYGAGYHCDG